MTHFNASTQQLAYLRTLHVGLPGRHEVRLVAPLPLDEEHELAAAVRSPDDALRLQPAVEAPGSDVLAGVKLLARWLHPLLAAPSPALPLGLFLLQLELVFKRLDELRTIQILFWLPGVFLGPESLEINTVELLKVFSHLIAYLP